MDRQTYWETKLAWVITVLALALSGWWTRLPAGTNRLVPGL